MSSHPHAPQHRKVAQEIARTCIQSVLLLLLLTTFLGRFIIHQTSMEPNFHEGQRIIVSKIGSLWNDIFIGTAHAAGKPTPEIILFRRGQIAIFYDNQAQVGDPLIKRVIGLPGDTIQIQDGAITINGERLDEPYLYGAQTTCQATCGPWILGDDEYFMLGDNRAVSRDSRVFGPICGSQMVGRVVLKYWPLEDLEFFP